MRGVNEFAGGGNVGNPIRFGKTGSGDPACSFMLAMEKGGAVTWARINVYGDLVRVCERKLEKGAYVFVVGELMNRELSGSTDDDFTVLTEVRARDVVFPNPRRDAPVG